MAIYDGLTLLCGAIAASGAITGQACNGAGNIISTNTVDLGPPGLGGAPGQLGDMGQGEPVIVDFHVRTAPTVGTSCEIQLIQADDAALTSGVQVLVSTGPMPIANLPAGRHVFMTWARSTTPKRYGGARIVNVGTVATFSVFAAVVADVQSQLDQVHFKGGFAIT